MAERDPFDPCPQCGRWPSILVSPANQDRPFTAVVIRCEPCGTADPVVYIPAHPVVVPITIGSGGC